MYGDQNKPKLEAFVNAEERILSNLNDNERMTYVEIKRLLKSYREKVTDVEKKDFFSLNKTHEKVLKFGNQLTSDKQVITKDNILFCLVQNILEDVNLPERTNMNFDIDGEYIAEAIKKEFVIPTKQ